MHTKFLNLPSCQNNPASPLIDSAVAILWDVVGWYRRGADEGQTGEKKGVAYLVRGRDKNVNLLSMELV